MLKTVTTTLGSCSLEHAADYTGYMILRGPGPRGQPAATFVTLGELEYRMRQSHGPLLHVQGIDAERYPLERAAQVHESPTSPDNDPWSSQVRVDTADIAAFLLCTHAVVFQAMAEQLATITPKTASLAKFKALDQAMRDIKALAVFAPA